MSAITAVNRWWVHPLIEQGCYAKQSEKDKEGMKGDRAARQTGDSYKPQGLTKPIYRPAGALRLLRGDTKISTLAKRYREFAGLQMFPGATLATLRAFYGKAGITDLRKAVKR